MPGLLQSEMSMPIGSQELAEMATSAPGIRPDANLLLSFQKLRRERRLLVVLHQQPGTDGARADATHVPNRFVVFPACALIA